MTITLTLWQLLGLTAAMFCVAYAVTDITKAILCAAKTAAALDDEAPADPVPPKWNATTDYHLLAPPLPPAISLDFAGFGLGWQGEPTGTFRTLDVDAPEPVLVGEVEPPTRARFERKPDQPLVEHVLTIDLHDERYDPIKVPLAVGR